MSQPFNPDTPTAANGQSFPIAPGPYYPAMSSFSAFPGLTSLVQSLTGVSEMALSTPAQPPPPQPQPPLSSDNSDLEKLERLKREILGGQNPVYKAVPQPDFLESLYLGRSVKRQNSVPAHPEQIVPSQSEVKTALPSNSEHTNGTPTVAEVNPLVPSKTLEEKERTDKEVGFEAPTSTQSAQAMNDGSNSAVVEFITPVKRSPSTPQFEPKVSSIDHRPSFSLGTVSQDAAKPPLDVPLGSTKLKSNMASQLAVLPTSDNVPARSSAEKSPVTSVPLGKAVFTSDPPYDPKESLRNSEFNAFADYRNTHAPVGYDSSSFASPNDTSPEGIHYAGRQRNYSAEWDDRFNYRYAPGHSGNIGDRQFSTSGVDYEGARFQDIKRQGTGQSYDDRADGDLRRFAPGFPDRSVGPAENCSLTSEQTSSLINSVDVTKAASGAAFVLNTSAAPLSSQYAPAEGQLTRNAKSNTYDQSALKESRLDIDGRPLPSNDTGRQSSMDYTPHQENIQASALEGRIGGHAPASLEDRIGIRIPLEERISSPPDGTSAHPASKKQEGTGDRSSLERRIDSTRSFSDVRGPAGPEVTRPADTRSIPTPLSFVRPRAGDEKVNPSQVSSSAGTQTMHQQTGTGVIYERPDEILQPRYSAHESGSRASLQGSPQESHSAGRSSFKGEPMLKERQVDNSTDPRLVPSAAYRGERGRSFTDGDRPFAESGFYERTSFRERDSIVLEERTRPDIESREWRERGANIKGFPPRSDSQSGSFPRVWGSNGRGSRPSDPSSDDRRYSDREYDRRSVPLPHSWDREEPPRIRPPLEVYPPPGDLDHKGYGPPEFREGSRIRGRSPSPNPLRRSTYNGAPQDIRPAKRIRDEAYFDDREGRYADRRGYPPSPPPTTAGGYYDSRPSYVPRDVHDQYSERPRPSDVGYYDRRVSDMGPPPSPPYTGRAIYSRPDLDRFNVPPRTA